ncbi:TPA: hypothetical protein QC096_002228 [Bacillus thuringiensis]|nr:hypothetical protein [Bacillus thuringiensis]
MKKIETLKTFLIENIHYLEPEGSSGTFPTHPEFDLYPRDFLKFAKTELNFLKEKKENLIHIINCLSHLKRAVDCQFDLFLYHLNLYELIKEKNLKFDKKLNFLKDIGIFESTSISRLNSIRNKMEHHYKIPDIVEIEVYFDLVNAFISIIESNLTLFLINHEVQIGSTNEEKFNFFNLEYVFDKDPKIIFEVKHLDEMKDFSVSVDASEQSEFAYYLRALFTMLKLDYMKRDFILNELI